MLRAQSSSSLIDPSSINLNVICDTSSFSLMNSLDSAYQLSGTGINSQVSQATNFLVAKQIHLNGLADFATVSDNIVGAKLWLITKIFIRWLFTYTFGIFKLNLLMVINFGSSLFSLINKNRMYSYFKHYIWVFSYYN